MGTRPEVPEGVFLRLSAREKEVARLIACGFSNKEVAAALDITEHTVKFYVNTMMAKTHTPSRTAAIVHLLQTGELELATLNVSRVQRSRRLVAA